MKNSTLVQDFITEIWNNKAFSQLDHFLHADFTDYSLPTVLTTDKKGTTQWILNTGVSFEHHTVIQDQVTQGNNSMVKIKMRLKHIGAWRGIEPTGIDLEIMGYRHFKFKDQKIVAHWALIDGQSIENQLKEASHGCKISR